MTTQVVEAALEEELNEHLGHDKHDPVGRGSGNSRNGTRAKTVITDNGGAIETQVPRDRNGTFEPQLVKKRQRRLSDMDAMVLSLFAKGLTTGEIAAHFAEVYATSVSKDTISRITDRVFDEMNSWMARPLEPIYAAIFIDAMVIRVRDGQVRNQPYYAHESVSTSKATRTFWGSGRVMGMASRRSSGSPVSRNSRTGV